MTDRPDNVPNGPSGPDSDHAVVDSRGERCPLPVIRLARAVSEQPRLRAVTILATDPAAAHDIPAWCRMRGHHFVTSRDEGDHTAYVVELIRPSAPAAEP